MTAVAVAPLDIRIGRHVRWYGVEECAAYLGCTVEAVKGRWNDGLLAYKTISGSRRTSQPMLEDYVNDCPGVSIEKAREQRRLKDTILAARSQRAASAKRSASRKNPKPAHRAPNQVEETCHGTPTDPAEVESHPGVGGGARPGEDPGVAGVS